MAYTYKYPRAAVTADCVIITNENIPKVLLIQRANKPFQGCWALPGGFMEMDETTLQCAIRELKEETEICLTDFQEIGVYSKTDRDPRGRTISIAYLSVIDSPIEATGQDDAAKAGWFSVDNLPPLAFDHTDILNDALNLYQKQQ